MPNKLTPEQMAALEANAREAASRDFARLQASGLEPNDTLARALAEKAAQEYVDRIEQEQAKPEAQPEKPSWWERWTKKDRP